MRMHSRLFIPAVLPFSLLLLIILSLSFQIIRTEESDVPVGVTATIAEECNDNDNDEEDGQYCYYYLKEARALKPPLVDSIDHGDTEGAEWWSEHQSILQLAWTQWEEGITEGRQSLPFLNASLIHPTLRRDVYRTWKEPTSENEKRTHRAWEEVLSAGSTKIRSKTTATTSNITIDDELQDKVYRYQNFLTPEGVRALRKHLDAISESGIPTRRPNAMNRNGLLLDPTVPGGVAGDAALHGFLETIVRDFIRPLGRSFFPAFCGNPEDDTTYYAFTIRYGHDDHDSYTTHTTTDLELKEHSDSSVFSLNLNLNLPDEEFSGSSVYFVTSEEEEEMNSNSNINNNATRQEDNNTQQQRQRRRELEFESGTALLHRGMTRHGAMPLESGQRNNLVIWLHGIDGYVRISPYEERERLSVSERWRSSSSSVFSL